MSTSRLLAGLVTTAAAIVAIVPMVARADRSPGLGEPMSADDVADVDFVVLPDGSGLPAGSGSVDEGRALYARHCLACHGEDGEDGINDRLAGGHDTLTGERPVKTVGSFWPYATTLFDYIRRAMPYQEPGTLTADEVYALSAYVLHINDIVPAAARLDAASLAAVRMPNRDNFVWVYREGEAERREK